MRFNESQTFRIKNINFQNTAWIIIARTRHSDLEFNCMIDTTCI